MFLGNFVSRIVLTVQRAHGFEFFHRLAAGRRVVSAVAFDHILQEVGALEHDATACGVGCCLAKVREERGFHHGLVDVAPIVPDLLVRKLYDRAGLDVAPGRDVMADTGRRGTQRATFMIPVGIDEADGFLATHLDAETSHLQRLLAREGELRCRIGTDSAIGVKPNVVHTHSNQFVQPGFLDEIVEVRSARTRGDTGNDLVSHARLDPGQGLVQDIGAPASLVGDDLVALDADQGGRVPDASQLLRHGIVDEPAVGEDLEVAVGMGGKNPDQVRMHEGFTAEDAEEAVAVLLRTRDQPIHFLEGDLRLRSSDVDPATGATQVAAVDDRDVEEGREDFALLQALLEAVDREHPLEAEVVGKLPQETGIRRAHHAHAK